MNEDETLAEVTELGKHRSTKHRPPAGVSAEAQQFWRAMAAEPITAAWGEGDWTLLDNAARLRDLCRDKPSNAAAWSELRRHLDALALTVAGKRKLGLNDDQSSTSADGSARGRQRQQRPWAQTARAADGRFTGGRPGLQDDPRRRPSS